MDERSRRKILEILRVLDESERPLGGTRIAQTLALGGTEMSQRTIRYYLGITDRQDLTAREGRRGRRLTERGRQELENAYVVDKVGFVAARVDALTYRMTFRLRPAKGEVVVNVSSLDARHLPAAARVLNEVFGAGLSMGQRLLLAPPGSRLGRVGLGPQEFGVATVCTMSVNGVLLSEGIPTVTRFGGLLQYVGGRPVRFTQIINYDGTTLDPLEIFIKGQMTSVGQVVRSGQGVVGASFREIPAPAAGLARRLISRMERIGLGGVILLGRPGQPLLEIPVHPGRVGLVVVGGLNPMAAVEEAGIPTHNRAMGTLMPFEDLPTYQEALTPYL
ncbi:MAG: NrpR regulatory domain-containing protein [Pseudomonadota bacterium]